MLFPVQKRGNQDSGCVSPRPQLVQESVSDRPPERDQGRCGRAAVLLAPLHGPHPVSWGYWSVGNSPLGSLCPLLRAELSSGSLQANTWATRAACPLSGGCRWLCPCLKATLLPGSGAPPPQAPCGFELVTAWASAPFPGGLLSPAHSSVNRPELPSLTVCLLPAGTD